MQKFQDQREVTDGQNRNQTLKQHHSWLLGMCWAKLVSPEKGKLGRVGTITLATYIEGASEYGLIGLGNQPTGLDITSLVPEASEVACPSSSSWLMAEWQFESRLISLKSILLINLIKKGI